MIIKTLFFVAALMVVASCASCTSVHTSGDVSIDQSISRELHLQK